MLTTLGPATPLVGAVEAEAHLSTGEATSELSFSAGGGVEFYFVAEQIRDPGISLATLPIYFSAQGQASISSTGAGDGTYNGSARIAGVPGFPIGLFSFAGLSNETSAFNDSVTFNLSVNREYKGILSAGCNVTESGFYGPAGTADCSVFIDPEIGFDQAAFDLQMGANTFDLNEYYAIAFSPNIPTSVVPLPSAFLLFSAGLAGLTGFSRWLKRSGSQTA